jgi:Rad3-related DNA helicase
MATAVSEACMQAQVLRIQAPTGLGKTLGALYPALKAMPERGLDRIYFLTARTTGRQLALETLALLTRSRGSIAPLRVLELVSRDRGCEYPDRQCHPQSCPLAKGFYDRLPAARQAAVREGLLDFAKVRSVALGHEICPYYLSHELLRHADVVVGDFNHWFDRHALLLSIATQSRWRVNLLIDEAHHLVDRARQNYSAELSEHNVLSVRGALAPSVRPALEAFINQWDLLRLTYRDATVQTPLNLLSEPPADWLAKLARLNASLGQWLAEQAIDPPRPLLDFYFQCQAFQDLADRFGEHSLCELRGQAASSPPLGAMSSPGLSLALRNVVPAGFIASALAAADSIILFSATLPPEPFDRHLLGLPDGVRTVALPSPFDPTHLQVRIKPVSTRFEQRARTLNTLVQTMLDQFHDRPGNYLAFFSSFDYLDAAFARTRSSPDAPPIWKQERNMNEARRLEFLSRFQPDGQGIAFAVLGGAFGEGIDLPGTRLIGAFVATLGLPQVDPVQEAIRERLQTLFGFGFEFTYLYPGLQKVIQAAGRVIRLPSDRGVLVLMDERYTQVRVRRLLPAHWGLDTD